MALPIYSRATPEAATTNVDFSAEASGIFVTADCTSVTLTIVGVGAVSLGDLPAGSCVTQPCTKVVFTGGAIKAFFIPE